MNGSGEKADVQAHSDSDRRSELAGRALAHGLALAKELKAPVTVLTVTQLWSAPEMALFSAGKANLDPMRQIEDFGQGDTRLRRTKG
jgi:nucleotide-binding universal stress UspA family protein